MSGWIGRKVVGEWLTGVGREPGGRGSDLQNIFFVFFVFLFFCSVQSYGGEDGLVILLWFFLKKRGVGRVCWVKGYRIKLRGGGLGTSLTFYGWFHWMEINSIGWGKRIHADGDTKKPKSSSWLSPVVIGTMEVSGSWIRGRDGTTWEF